MPTADLHTSSRLFVAEPLAAGAVVPLTPAQAHHLGTVLRQGPGTALRLFNGSDGEWLARLASLRRGAAVAEVARRLRPQGAEPDMWLAFAPLKRDATDLLVEKATELGVAALLPVLTERTNTARLNLDRLAAIATAAAEQCERLTVPRIDPLRPLAALLADWPGERRLFVAVERSAAPPLGPAPPPCALLVGPEGGFAPAELELFARHPLMTEASLGPLVLRAETAAIVGLARLQTPAGGG
jgi:16S rRNA (uracil1498-N3)-methyltransferase